MRLVPLSPRAVSTVAAIAIVACFAGAATEGSGQATAGASGTSDRVTYWRSTWHHATMYVGRAGRPVLNPAAALYAIARDASEEYWVSRRDGARVQYGRDGAAYLPTAADRRAWKKAGSPDLDKLMGPASVWGPRRTTVSARKLDELLLGGGELVNLLPAGAPLRDLPVDATALQAALQTLAWRQRTEISREGDAACRASLPACPEDVRGRIDDLAPSFATTLLEYPFAPKRLRVALIDALRTLPGARDAGTIRDPAGRAGSAILLPKGVHDGLDVLVIDRVSDRLFAVGMARNRDLDEIMWSKVIAVRRATVARIGARPRHP